MDANALTQKKASQVKAGRIFFFESAWWLRGFTAAPNVVQGAICLTGKSQGIWEPFGQELVLTLIDEWDWMPKLDEPIKISSSIPKLGSIIITDLHRFVVATQFVIDIPTGIVFGNSSRAVAADHFQSWKVLAHPKDDESRVSFLFEI